jgi:anti-sigma-K factor RskA
MTGPQDPPDDTGRDLPGGDAALCAEYVLGLLGPEETAAFEARFAQEPDLQEEVAYWAENFADLAVDLPDVQPAPAVLRRIEVAAFGPARPPLWRQVLPYILGSAAAAAIAWAASVSGLLYPTTGPTNATGALRAELTPPATDSATGEDAVRADILFDPNAGTLTLTLTSGTAPAGRVFELWLVADSTPPISLGLVTPGTTIRNLPADLASRLPGAGIALSDEPAGGSATGQPTEPVRALGSFTDT